MTTRRRIATRVAIPLALAAAVAGLGAGPAGASVSSISVTPGTSITADTTVTVSASSAKVGVVATGSRTLTLAIARPDGGKYSWPSKSVPNTQDGTISGSFSTVTPPWSSGGLAAANGQYTVTSTDGSSTSKTVPVTLAIAPSDVAGFAGSASGSVATFSWKANTDNVPDFAGYQISNGTSTVKVTPSSGACDATSCGVSIDYGSGARGQTYSFSIVALRLRGPGSTSTVASANPATTSVAFPAAPSAAPSTGGTDSSGGGTSTSGDGSTGDGSSPSTSGAGNTSGTGGTTSGGTTSGGSTGGSTTAAGNHGPVITGKNPHADLSRFLPTLSAGAAPNLPAVVTEIAPIPQGTYKPTLAYPDQTVTTTTRQAHGGRVSAVGTDIVKVLNMAVIWKALAGAALLLLVTAHLRSWLDGIETSD